MASLILNVGTTWEWSTWLAGRSNPVPTAYEDSMNILLNYSRVHSPSWEANWFAASQEIPRISRNPKVHNRTHKRSMDILRDEKNFLCLSWMESQIFNP